MHIDVNSQYIGQGSYTKVGDSDAAPQAKRQLNINEEIIFERTSFFLEIRFFLISNFDRDSEIGRVIKKMTTAAFMVISVGCGGSMLHAYAADAIHEQINTSAIIFNALVLNIKLYLLVSISR